MAVEDMQERAQGRVWSGEDALQQRLIDAIGGVSRAVAIAKQAAGLGAHSSPSPSHPYPPLPPPPHPLCAGPRDGRMRMHICRLTSVGKSTRCVSMHSIDTPVRARETAAPAAAKGCAVEAHLCRD